MAMKIRSLNVDDEQWARWQAEAKALGISLTALIKHRMDAGEGAVISPPKALAVLRGDPSLASVVLPDLAGEAVGYRPKASWKPKPE